MMVLVRLVGGAVLLLLVVAGGIYAADWPFWNRYLDFPDDPGEWPASFYQPTHDLKGPEGAFFPTANEAETAIPASVLKDAAAWAESRNSAALLVLHRGKIVTEEYWQGIDAESLFSGRAMTRTLVPFLIGIALDEELIGSLDDPVSKYIEEWTEEPRGGITLRQLLHNVSGIPTPPDSMLPYSPSIQSAIGSDFERIFLDYEPSSPPGTNFAVSNPNAQLLGIVLERATGRAYEELVQEKVWTPMGGGTAEFFMDRKNGMPAVYCCFRATPHDWLRLGALMLNDGMVDGKRVLPEGWIEQMQSPSGINPNYGLHLWVGSPPGKLREYVPGSGIGVPHSEAFLAEDIFFAEGGGYRTLYVIPSADLVILRLGYADEDWDSSALPNIILKGLSGTPALN